MSPAPTFNILLNGLFYMSFGQKNRSCHAAGPGENTRQFKLSKQVTDCHALSRGFLANKETNNEDVLSVVTKCTPETQLYIAAQSSLKNEVKNPRFASVELVRVKP